MNEISYNLNHGTVAVVVPEVFKTFREKPFTSQDAIKEVECKYCSASIIQKMHKIGYIEPVKDTTVKQRPTRWKFRREVIPMIEKFVNNNYSKEKDGN
jgi:hypothetical protein